MKKHLKSTEISLFSYKLHVQLLIEWCGALHSFNYAFALGPQFCSADLPVTFVEWLGLSKCPRCVFTQAGLESNRSSCKRKCDTVAGGNWEKSGPGRGKQSSQHSLACPLYRSLVPPPHPTLRAAALQSLRGGNGRGGERRGGERRGGEGGRGAALSLGVQVRRRIIAAETLCMNESTALPPPRRAGRHRGGGDRSQKETTAFLWLHYLSLDPDICL